MEGRFSVRVGAQTMILPTGEVAIGRDDACAVQLDDERASRRHALLHVGDDQIAIEDLSSRNGCWVDGVRVEGRVELSHGSVIAIGDARIVVLDSASRQGRARTAQSLVAARRPTVAAPPRVREAEVTTFTGASLGSLALGASAALRGGDSAELGNAISLVLDHLAREDVRADPALSDALAAATEGALSLAAIERDPSWIDRVFDANGKYFRVLDREAIHRIHELSRDLSRGDPEACATYIQRLRARKTPLDTQELQQVRRLEAMRHALAAR